MALDRPIGTEESQSICASCGLQAPTKRVEFRQNIGMLITRQSVKRSGFMCRRCIWAYFKSFTLTTLFLGWWGMISFVVTPIFLINNFLQLFKLRGLLEPPAVVANVPYESASKAIAVGVGNRRFKLAYGAIVTAAVLGFIAYNSVDFLNKYAPSLNATLHSGKVAEGADAEYARLEIGKDMKALEAPTKSKNWSGWRAEILAREPYLRDLKAQNARLQAAYASERTSGGADDGLCEQLAAFKFGPPLNEYTNAMVQVFSTTRATTKLNKPAQASLLASFDRDKDARKRMSDFFAAGKAEGCER